MQCRFAAFAIRSACLSSDAGSRVEVAADERRIPTEAIREAPSEPSVRVALVDGHVKGWVVGSRSPDAACRRHRATRGPGIRSSSRSGTAACSSARRVRRRAAACKLCPSSCIRVDACMNAVPVGVTLSLSRNAPSVTSTSPPGKSPMPVFVIGFRNMGFTVVELGQKRLEPFGHPEMVREKRVVEHVLPHLVEAADTCVAGLIAVVCPAASADRSAAASA